MKNIFKRITSMTLVLLMTFGMSATAFAADSTITYRGITDGFEFQPGSEYTATDLFDNFKGVMPGDVLTEEITFTNSDADCGFVRLYMRAVAHDEKSNPISEKAAESETITSMTQFLSQLSMKVWNGTELIYDASPDELDGLAENVFLGTFRTGETATLKVELTVPIQLGNEFADRVGEVDWIFHVEAYNESQISVRKVWSDGNGNHTKDNVTVNLLKDGSVESTVVLNAENGWTYTFDKLVEGHTWAVEEAEVPKGYVVSYDIADTNVIITNTNVKTLIQTGQLNWPIAVFGGVGIALIALGGVMILVRKKRENA